MAALPIDHTHQDTDERRNKADCDADKGRRFWSTNVAQQGKSGDRKPPDRGGPQSCDVELQAMEAPTAG